MILSLLMIGLSVWVIFMGGAERLEHTVLGYFEFGFFADKAQAIRILAWVSLIANVALLFL